MCSSDRVHRWRLILEEYGPEINLIKGIHNTIADAIARLDFPPKANHVQEMDANLDDTHKMLVYFGK